MNANAHFEIGNRHTVCQDYAIAESLVDDGVGGAYAIVCDGCSASPDVDMGARLLALSAKRTLFVGGEKMNYDIFGKVTIRNLETIRNVVPFHQLGLDATLLAAWVTSDNQFNAHLYGDGVFIHQTATTLRVVHVDFESGAPAYLSYHLDKGRMEAYKEGAKGRKVIRDVSFYRGDSEDPSRDTIDLETFAPPFDPVSFTGLVSPGDIIAVASDGVNSFSKTGGDRIDWDSIVREFIDFKNVEGVFVQRRLSAMKRKFAKEGIGHYDDISMAAIVI